MGPNHWLFLPSFASPVKVVTLFSYNQDHQFQTVRPSVHPSVVLFPHLQPKFVFLFLLPPYTPKLKEEGRMEPRRTCVEQRDARLFFYFLFFFLRCVVITTTGRRLEWRRISHNGIGFRISRYKKLRPQCPHVSPFCCGWAVYRLAISCAKI